jgi:cytochrome c oxidase subunit IV
MENMMLDPAADPATPPPEKPHANYILVFVMLAVLTAIELGVAFVGLSRTMTIVALILLALWKALLVALYYMHLRYEPKRVHMLVLTPIPLILILLFAVLTEY